MGERQRRVVEGDQVGDADDGARQGVVDHRDHLHGSPAGKAPPGHEVAHEDSEEPAERHAHSRDDERVADGLHPLREDHVVVAPRQGVVGAEGHYHGGVEEERVEVGDDQTHARAGRKQEPPRPRRHALRGGRGPGLAGHGDVGAARDPGALEEIDEGGGHEGREGQHGAAFEVEEPGDLQVRLGRQHGEGIAGEDQRRGEVGQRGREEEEEGIGEARRRQRQRDGAEHAPARGPQRERHVLHVRIDGRQDGPHRQVGDGEVGQRLREERAVEAIGRGALDAEQVIGNEPARAEGEDHGDRGREGRGDERQKRGGIERREPTPAQPGARRGIGEEKTERGAADADERRQQQAVEERVAVIGIAEHSPGLTEREAAAVDEGEPGEPRQRVEDEECQQRPEDEDGDPESGVAPEPPHGGRHSFAFNTSLIQRSTTRLRLAPA